MIKFIIHAFVVPSGHGITVLPLSEVFDFRVLPNSAGNEPGLTVEVITREPLLRNVIDLNVDSLTIVYGVNGGGKTGLLLRICNTLSRERGERPLGILWGDGNNLFFDKGSHLRRIKFQGNAEVVGRLLPRNSSFFGTIFYTTSPFETSRRRRSLSPSETLDVTPSFSSEAPFNGVSLLCSAKALPKNLPFIETAEVLPKIKIPSLQSLIEEYTSLRIRKNVPSEPRYVDLKGEALALIKRLPNMLTGNLSFILAIEMCRARFHGKDEMSILLLQLVDALANPDLGGGIVQFLDSRAIHWGDLPSAFQVFDALQSANQSGMGLSKKGLFMDFVTVAENWSQRTVEGLQHAEDLGLLKWSFLKLSSGQIAMLMLFSSLAGALVEFTRLKKQNVVLAIDEGEMFMHPSWQRVYLTHLLNFLALYRMNFQSIHLVISTHSLIVAGDAPPNRLYDVVTGEIQNGFAASAEELLKTVYHIDSFGGEFVDSLYKKISNFLRKGGNGKQIQDIQFLVSQIASKRLRDYLQEEIDRRKGI